MKKLLLTLTAVMLTSLSMAAVSINKVGGWFEGGYVTWSLTETAKSYAVYCRAEGGNYQKLDSELVRNYGTYGRADIVGIKAGKYQFKVVPVSADGKELAEEAAETETFTAVAHDRGGFAHFKTASSTFNPANGIGAYKNDGTLKDGAKVIYVYADNAKTITTDVITNSKGGTTTYTGMQAIIDGYQKGYDKTPICFRIIGTIKAADMDGFSSSAEGVQIKGRNAYSEMNITIEGIGHDATVHGFGFLLRNACSVELRNFAIMWCMDDAVSMDTDNCNLWIHNLDLFYGKPGSAADQKKGDGTLDIKGDSKYSTLSYNHLWDSGKSSLCGMTSESGPNYLTYHHNWFDHSDSRHPRIRTMSVHIYNNYYDGNSKYGVGATTGADVFVENNYFRACKYPMLSSKQGSDVHNGVGSSDDTKGTFSGEAGGSIKAFGNYMTGQRSFEPYKAGDATYSKHFDAYVVESRSEKVPASVTALLGGDTYSNFDTDASLFYSGYTVHEASEVPGIIKGEFGAGRLQHGDFSWEFGPNEDNNAEVITSLSTAVQNYKSTLVGFFGTNVSNGGGSENQGGSSNNGTEGGSTSDSTDDSGSDNTVKEEIFLAGQTTDDYFFFNADNKAKVEALIADGTITLVDAEGELGKSAFNPDYSYDAVANGKTFASTEYTGSLNLAKATSAGKTDGGAVIFRCPKGVTTFAAYMYRTGSVYLHVYTSIDGVKWTKVESVDKAAAGIYEKNFSSTVANPDHALYVKIQNTSTGGLNVQGVRILCAEGATDMPFEENTGEEDPGTNPGGSEVSAGDFTYSQNAIYAFAVTQTVAQAMKDGQPQNYSDTIKTVGGKFVYGNVTNDKIAASTVAQYGFGYKLDGDASETSTKYALAILDEPLKAGDVITISCYAASSPKNDYGITVLAGSMTGKTLGQVFSTAKNVEEKLTLTVTADFEGETRLYFVRNASKSTYFTGVEVNREGYVSGLTSLPSASVSSKFFNLQGQQILAPAKGQIYMNNGKKVIFK